MLQASVTSPVPTRKPFINSPAAGWRSFQCGTLSTRRLWTMSKSRAGMQHCSSRRWRALSCLATWRPPGGDLCLLSLSVPVYCSRMARASSHWCALCPGFLYALLGRTLSGASLTGGSPCKNPPHSVSIGQGTHAWLGWDQQVNTCRCGADPNKVLCSSASELRCKDVPVWGCCSLAASWLLATSCAQGGCAPALLSTGCLSVCKPTGRGRTTCLFSQGRPTSALHLAAGPL